MKELSPLEKLNAVLQTLLNYESKGKHDLFSVKTCLLLDKVDIKQDELELILDKLSVDKYIYLSMATTNTETKIYWYINFDGKLFIQTGGYVRKHKLENKSITTAKVLNFTIVIKWRGGCGLLSARNNTVLYNAIVSVSLNTLPLLLVA